MNNTISGFDRLSGDYIRGYTKAIKDIIEVFDYVNDDLYYYYATETEFGYKTEKVSADNAYIKYTDGETHIEKYAGEFVNDIPYLFGYPICEDRYIIYCPDGTVTNEFNVDLE